MIDIQQFRDLVVRPVLLDMDMWSPAAEELLVGTAVHESGGLTYIQQLGGGPALGVFQIEPATHDDVVLRYAAARSDIHEKLKRWSVRMTHEELPWNLAYGCAVARVKFYMDPAPMPAANNIVALGEYWKRIYNTELGAGTVSEWVYHYNKWALN